MPILGWFVVSALAVFLATLEILEGHAVQLAMVGAGLLALIGRMRFGESRPILAVASTMAGFVAFLAIGLTHWFDGRLDALDGISLLVLSMLMVGVIGEAIANKTAGAAQGRADHSSKQ